MFLRVETNQAAMPEKKRWADMDSDSDCDILKLWLESFVESSESSVGSSQGRRRNRRRDMNAAAKAARNNASGQHELPPLGDREMHLVESICSSLVFNPPTRQVKEQMLLELLGPFEHPVANLSEELSKWFEDFLFDRFASAESLPSLELRERICQQVQLLGFIQFCGRCIFATDPDPVRSLQYIRFATSFRSIYKLPPLCETLYQVAHANFATVVLTKMENEMTEAQSKELKDSFRFLQISGRHLPGVHPEAPRVNLQARIPQIWKDAKKTARLERRFLS